MVSQLTLPQLELALPAQLIHRGPTSQDDAWAGGHYWTVLLLDAIPALRLHGRGLPVKLGSSTTMSRPKGDWFSIAENIMGQQDFTSTFALQWSMPFVALCTLKAGSVLNIGRCSPIFRDNKGGGVQAEFWIGPPPVIQDTGSSLAPSMSSLVH